MKHLLDCGRPGRGVHLSPPLRNRDREPAYSAAVPVPPREARSATWRAAYEAAQRGETISVPYHDVKVTDPKKLARMTAAYRAFSRGELKREQLPDIRDVYPDDLQLLAEMGFGTEPGLDGGATLLSACSQCHHSQLDPSLSRARFRADMVDTALSTRPNS